MDFNHATLIGRVATTPEVNKTKGTSMARFRLAVNKHYKDKTTQERKSTVSYFNVLAFGPVTDFISKRLTKGTEVLVDGELRSHIWKGKDNKSREDISLVPNIIQLTASAPKGAKVPTPVAAEVADTIPSGEIPF